MFPVSPAVIVREFSVDTIVPQVALTPAVIAGVFHWGPLEERVLVDSESALVNNFFKPSNLNAETWFSAANYLSYGGNLWVSRAADTTGSGNVVLSSVTAVVGNTTVTVASTTGITAGQVLYYSNNESSVNPSSNGAVTIASITNATAFVLSSAPAANATVTLIFRDNITYTAAAQETATPNINWAGQIVKNDSDYEDKDGTFNAANEWLARFPGNVGNSLRIAQCDSADQFSSNTDLTDGVNATSSGLSAEVGSNTITFTFVPTTPSATNSVQAAANLASDVKASLNVGDLIQVGNSKINYQMLTVASVEDPVTGGTNTTTFTITTTDNFKLSANVTNTNLQRYWEFYNVVDSTPGQSTTVRTTGNTSANDELHVVVVDAGGKFTGVCNTVLEVYKNVSRATDAKDPTGQTLYYKDVINKQSRYVRWANDRSGAASATAALVASSTQTEPYNVTFVGGADGVDESSIAISELSSAYDLYLSPDDVDIGLVITGKARGIPANANTQLASYLINNLAEIRKDCVVFCSPDRSFVVNNVGEERNDLVAARNSMPSTSYAFHDSGYKYQYDRYNDVYRWIPLNGDMAGLAARTDMTNDPWWSFAGLTRGFIKNCVKLAWNPRQADRDELYKAGINSVITTRGQGFYLWGDKTMLTKTDPFDHINVRRLFIVLEKAIATAAKYSMFEFNDDFTRAQFRAMVNPFLKDVQGRRGITSFYVQCDGDNNPGSVIDANQFKAAIFIKPARSINTIVLDFVAVGTDVSFNEIIKKYG